MRTTQTVVAVVAVIALTAAPATAASGVLIAQKVTSGSTTTTQSQIEPTRMRSEIASSAGRKQTVVFDGAAQVLRMIDDDGKTAQ